MPLSIWTYKDTSHTWTVVSAEPKAREFPQGDPKRQRTLFLWATNVSHKFQSFASSAEVSEIRIVESDEAEKSFYQSRENTTQQ